MDLQYTESALTLAWPAFLSLPRRYITITVALIVRGPKRLIDPVITALSIAVVNAIQLIVHVRREIRLDSLTETATV